MSEHLNYKSPSWGVLRTIVSVTVLTVLLLCCTVLCDQDSSSSVPGSETHHKEPENAFAHGSRRDKKEDGNKLLSDFANSNELKFEDFADSNSFSKEKFSAPKSCNILYMVVSTIDGKVSALDLLKQGSLTWSIEADSQPLYSSSLAQMEIVRNGKKIRLIPSLDGAIYQFDGEKVEAIPMSADSLLSSTYQLSDDSMIVGSKDIRNYGVNLKTGQVLFTCSSDGCTSQGETENSKLNGNDVVIITRSTQIVRSVDMKNGLEKWNFSVGDHKINVPPSDLPSQIDDGGDSKEDSLPFFSTPKKECPEKERNPDDVDYESLLQLIVPEGKVVALDKKQSRKVAWEHKFGSPIAKAWLLRNGKLEPMNLFDPKHVPTLTTFTVDDLENESISQPMLYIGSHNKLLYIQPSPQMERILKTFPTHRIGHVFDPKIKVSWRPYLSTASVRTPIFGGNKQHIMHEKGKEKKDKGGKDTSLTVWHEDYPFDTGYFLYPEFRDSRSIKKGQLLMIEDLQQSGSLIEYLPASIWCYWKEIASLTVVVSIVVHVLLTRYLTPVLIPPVNVTEEGDSMELGKHDSSNSHDLSTISENSQSTLAKSSEEYISRFATDFNCLHCLGKGGFGIVFEAINKLDGQHYAVKRIMLPKSDGAKGKVLREVKALAQLEHPGIVRYFNSWEESPPPGWQKEWDMSKGLCDDTKGILNTSTKSVPTVQSETRWEKYVDGNFISEPNLETGTDTDSVVFLPDSTVAQPSPPGLIEHGNGSGEFTVHSDFTESNSWSHECSNQRPFSLLDRCASSSSDVSKSGSKSSVPFSNYTSNSSNRNGNSDFDLSGDSVVFEASRGVDVSKRLLPQNNVQYSNSRHPVIFSLSEEDGYEKAEERAQTTTTPRNMFFVYIQTQLYQKETLKEWLSNNTLNRERSVILEIFDQITCAVDYVHSQDLMHRDLKPSNIFFAADGTTIKVGDFGLATAFSAKQETDTLIDESVSSGRHTADVGTTLYMSPEQKNGKTYNLKVDIFALGLIFLELWVPFSTQMERIRTLQDARRNKMPDRFMKELPIESELVNQMTSHDPCLRPSTKEILGHDLLKEVAIQRIGLRNRSRTISGSSNN